MTTRSTLTRRSLLVPPLLVIAVLAFLCSSSPAATDQQQNRPPVPLLIAPCEQTQTTAPDRPKSPHESHDFYSERLRKQGGQQSLKPEQAPPAEEKSEPAEKKEAPLPLLIAYSDQNFLSALLAREELLQHFTRMLLQAPGNTETDILDWAILLHRQSTLRIAFAQKILPSLGGLKQDMYLDIRRRLAQENSEQQMLSPGVQFVLFLYPYCKESMADAIPALMDSSYMSIAEMAREILMENAFLSSAIRAKLSGEISVDDL